MESLNKSMKYQYTEIESLNKSMKYTLYTFLSLSLSRKRRFIKCHDIDNISILMKNDIDVLMKIEHDKLMNGCRRRRGEIYNSISLICIMKKKIRFYKKICDIFRHLPRLPTETVNKIIEYVLL